MEWKSEDLAADQVRIEGDRRREERGGVTALLED